MFSLRDIVNLRSFPVPLIAILLAVVAAAAQSPTPAPDDALVHYGDIIDVDFVGSFEFDWRGPVAPDGTLAGLDEMAGPIPAVCRTEAAIADDIVKAYGRILRAPNVKVRIVDRSGRAVATLDGAIRTPTRFRIQRPAHLRELIVLAGGLTDSVSGEIRLLRPRDLNCTSPPAEQQGSSLQTRTIKITDLLAGNPEADPLILSGDTIDIVRADPVYVIGAVVNPRPVAIKPELTVSRAIANVGGVTKDSDGRATVFRRKGGETTITEVDLNRIKRGETVDLALLAFDIIDVAGKGAKTRKFPPVTSSTNRSPEKRELPLRVIDQVLDP